METNIKIRDIIQNIYLVSSFLLAMLAVILLTSPAYAAGITVDSTADIVADDGACTLREAITNANNDDQSGSTDCMAGSGADAITFSVDGTITLGSTLPEIGSDVTIDGAGRSVTVSGDDAHRVIVVATTGTLNLNALTITDGFAPSGDLSGNGAGIFNDGILTVNNSTFFSNDLDPFGGTIANNNTATINNSTFTDNSSHAIVQLGYDAIALTINNSTIVGNYGGIFASYDVVSLNNSIVADNGIDCDYTQNGSYNADGQNMDSDGTCGDATTQTAAQLNLGSLADNGGETQTIALLQGSTAIDAATTGPATDQRGVARPQFGGFDVGAYEFETVVQSGPTFTVNSLADDSALCEPDDCTLRGAINAANAVDGANTIIFSVDGTITLGSTLPEISSDVTIDGAGRSVTVSGDDAHRVIVVATTGTLNLNALTITDGFAPSGDLSGNGAGIFNDGILTVNNSTFFSNDLDPFGGTIANNNTATINNSTFTDNSSHAIVQLGYDAIALTINNSTIVSNYGGIFASYDVVSLNNSIVADNGIDCDYTQNGSYNADGQNMDSDGTCGDATTQTAAQLNLGSLADNGGETQTIALLQGSTAIDAATTGPATDQRSVARPQGNAFDVGAYEAEPFCSTFPVTVSDQAGLNEAIDRYNAITTAGSYTINLAGDIALTASTTTINNPTADVELLISGAGFMVDGQDRNGVRPFTIAANTNVAIDAITVTGGDPSANGGAIHNSGSLTLTNSILRNNRACQFAPFLGRCDNLRGGALFNNGGTVAIVDSTISNNTLGDLGGGGGGGIYNANSGTIHIISSSVVGNSNDGDDGDGGGIHNDSGTITVQNSTITGNESSSNGDAGGIYNNDTLTVSNSTLSGNDGGFNGGALHNTSNGTATFINSTVTTNSTVNGGGMYNSGQITLRNTLVSGNQSNAGDEIFNTGGGTITAGANNLFGQSGQDSASLFGNFTPGGSDINAASDGTQPTTLTAILDTTLADNGGSTQTHALVADSLAANAGDNALAVDSSGNVLTTDQRGAGFPRIVGGIVDIGALESDFIPNSAPVAADDAYSTNQDMQLDVAAPGVLSNDSDADGDALTAVEVSAPSNGTLTLNSDGSFAYVPNAGFTGDDSFTYVANDGSDDSNIATVTITVNAVSAPFATCGGYDVYETASGYEAPSFSGNLVVGTDGYDWLIGTGGPDLILGLQAGDDIWGKGGDDVICGGAGVDIILGNGGNDTIYGDDQPDWLIGGSGNDTLYGGNGNDDLYGNSGNDILHGEAGKDVLLGGAHHDTLYGGEGNDNLYGNLGNDSLTGGPANDFCLGGFGNDTIAECEGISAANVDEAEIDEDDARRSNDGANGEHAIEQRIQQNFLPLITN